MVKVWIVVELDKTDVYAFDGSMVKDDVVKILAKKYDVSPTQFLEMFEGQVVIKKVVVEGKTGSRIPDYWKGEY